MAILSLVELLKPLKELIEGFIRIDEGSPLAIAQDKFMDGLTVVNLGAPNVNCR